MGAEVGADAASATESDAATPVERADAAPGDAGEHAPSPHDGGIVPDAATRDDGGSTSGDGGPSDGSSSAPDAGDGSAPDAGGGDASPDASTDDCTASANFVWVIDDSGSMLPYVVSITNELTALLARARAHPGHTSTIVLTGPIMGSTLAAEIDDPDYHWVSAPVQSYDAFEQALAQLDTYRAHFVPGAKVQFVFVSDDRSSMEAGAFITGMNERLGEPFTVHAVATDELGGACTGPAEVGGVEYFRAAERTGGVQMKLCAPEVVAHLGPRLPCP